MRLSRSVAVGVVAGLAALFPAREASAAPPASAGAPVVTRETRPPRVDYYDDAARRLNIQEWGSAEQNDRAVHVLLRLQRRRAVVSIALPPGTPVDPAERWLADLSREMGWNAQLSSNVQPGGVFLRAALDKVGHPAGPGQNQVELDVPTLRARIAELTPVPVWLGVRTGGAAIVSATPPAAKGESDGNDFLFYRLDTAPAVLLTVRYGLSPRWMAAALSFLVLWLLFPPLVLSAGREHLRRQSRADPKERLRAYRRLTQGVGIITPFGFVAFLYLFKMERLGYLLGDERLLMRLLPLIALFTFAGIIRPGRLIGLPLERDAYPERARQPWYRLLATDLISTGVVLAVIAVGVGLSTFAGGAGGVFPSAVRPLLLAVIIVPMLVSTVGVVIGTVAWRRRLRGVTTEPEAPEAVATAVRLLTADVGCPVERVLTVAGKLGTPNYAILRREHVVVIGKDLVEALEPDQVAALTAAQALAEDAARPDPIVRYGLWVFMLLPVAVGALAIQGLASGSFMRMGGPMLLVCLMMPLVLLFGTMTARRAQKRQEEADLRVADALPEPRRFLDAIRRLQELQLSAAGIEAAADPSKNERLSRLQRRLGLE
jgi:hypothetical protein